MESIKFTNRVTEEDYVKFLIFSIFKRKRFNRIFLLFISPFLGVIFLLFFIFIPEEYNVSMILVSIFLIIFGPGFRIFYGRFARKTYRKDPLLKQESEISFDEERIKAISKRGESIFPYTDFTKVYETNEHIIIYIGYANFIGLSKTCIGPDKTILIQRLLQENLEDNYIFRF